jgi:hypothetical protein
MINWVRLHNKPKPQNYPEVDGVNVADRWKERLRSYPGVVRQIKSTTIRHFILTGIAEKRSNKAYYKHLIRQIK